MDSEDQDRRPTVISFGTFDLLHRGHVLVLERALRLGQSKLGPSARLVVGVSTDALNARKNKQAVVPFAERLAVVKALRCVDDAFAEESLEAKKDYCEKYDAQLLVMGSDHDGRFDWCGVETAYLPRTEGVSTTSRRRELVLGAVTYCCKLAVPTLLTTCNFVCGVGCALGWLSDVWLIVGLWCDALDGATARWLHACTDFGAKFDSFADAAAWAIAPATMAIRAESHVVPAVVFGAAGVARLARFTFGTTLKGTRRVGNSRFFVGLCSPHATMLWLALAFHPAFAFVFATLEHLPHTFDVKATPYFPFLPEIVLTGLVLLSKNTTLLPSNNNLYALVGGAVAALAFVWTALVVTKPMNQVLILERGQQREQQRTKSSSPPSRT